MYEGWTVPLEYDPLLAKLIGYGTDRVQATMRLRRALYEYFVTGIKTNISLFQRILEDSEFQAAKLDTGYLDRLLARPRESVADHDAVPAVAAIAAGLFAVLQPVSSASGHGNAAGPAALSATTSNWKRKGRSEALR